MLLIRKSDGKRFDGIAEAVDDIRCPGPCGPSCPLYPTVRLDGDDTYGHMCHPGYYRSQPTAVAEALGCAVVGQTESPVRTYAAVIRSGAVRDVQYCKDEACDPTDDDAWDDLPDAEIFLGFFSGPDALRQAAEYGRTVPANIRLVPVPGKTGDA